MAKVAIMGYGTVGSGVARVLTENADVVRRNAGEALEIAYILDIRDFPGDPFEDRIVKDADLIADDPEVTVVAEVMGGTGAAYTFTKKMLEAGKSVCTSNKALVAEHGQELCAVAKEHGAAYLYEASCGGGIPVIRPLRNALTADRILSLGGIFNGTTNFILTKMEQDGGEYADVLHLAQELGYAEADPSADVDGWDACRKLAILGSIAYGKQISYKDIRTEGISRISRDEILYAEALGKRVKLLAVSRAEDDAFYAAVMPVMIGPENPLYPVSGVFNAVLVRGNMLDDVMLYGQGAGRDATGSAVVSDMIDAVRHGADSDMDPIRECVTPDDPENMRWRFFFRTDEDESAVLAAFPGTKAVRIPEAPDEAGYLTGEMKEKEFKAASERFSMKNRWVRVQ